MITSDHRLMTVMHATTACLMSSASSSTPGLCRRSDVCVARTSTCVPEQVVHGDMKSQNVLLTRNWDIAKIADVGVARFAKGVDVAGNDDLASACGPCVLPEPRCRLARASVALMPSAPQGVELH